MYFVNKHTDSGATENAGEAATDGYWCQVCKLSGTQSAMFITEHMQGAKHLKKVAANELLQKLKETTDCFDHDETTGMLKCNVCNMVVTSPQHLEAHFIGSKHKKKMEERPVKKKNNGDPNPTPAKRVLPIPVLSVDTPPKGQKMNQPQPKNPLSTLNELHPGLEFKTEAVGDLTHDPLFSVTIELNGEIFKGTGRSKKQAKHAAAETTLQTILKFQNTSVTAQTLGMDSSSAHQDINPDITGINFNANGANGNEMELIQLEDNFEGNFKEVQATKERDDDDDDASTNILSNHSFSWLAEKGLCSTPTLEVLTSQGLHALTHIQYKSFPHLINKIDCFLHARTGSGKTLAYLMPAIERLKAMEFKAEFGVGCLVVSPTRELAQQIKKVLEPLAEAHNFTSLTLIGGIKESRNDRAKIPTGAVIVVGTPGRLLDAVTRDPGEALPISRCQILILDEGDSILENSSQVDAVKKIYSHISNDKLQKVLCSATVSDKCLQLANGILRADFKVLSTEKEKNRTSTEQIKQNYLLVSSGDRFSMLVTVLKTLNKKKTIVFFSSGHSVRFHYQVCQRLGLPVLHCFGRMRQGERSSTYEKFLQMPKGILLSTGMAERGWDVPGVQWIIQFDPPHNPQDYVHRVGRSGRGEGAKGKSLLFLRPQEQEFLTILKNMNVDIDKLEFQGNLVPIQAQIMLSITKERGLHKGAKVAYKKFVRAYQCHKYKKVFNVKMLDLHQVCKDFGFIKPPMELHLKTLK